MKVTVSQLAMIAGGKPDASNMQSIVLSLDKFGREAGLDVPHRLAQFIPQLAHESGRFKYDREIWGPTPAQKRYEDRKDLGHSSAVAGEAAKFKGRTGIQITGRANYRSFTNWCEKRGYKPPDFEENPDLVNTDPWEGLVPIWYWSVGNPTGKSLNSLADEANIEQITKRINGGLNGYADRLALYTRTGLVLLGYKPDALLEFQKRAKEAGTYDGDLDNEDGPRTRAALHLTLSKMRNGEKVTPAAVKAAPVVEETTVAVAPKAAENTLWTRLNGGVAFLGTPFLMFWEADWMTKLVIGGVVLAAVGFLLFKGEMIAARVKSVLKAFDENEVVR